MGLGELGLGGLGAAGSQVFGTCFLELGKGRTRQAVPPAQTRAWGPVRSVAS